MAIIELTVNNAYSKRKLKQAGISKEQLFSLVKRKILYFQEGFVVAGDESIIERDANYEKFSAALDSYKAKKR